MAKFLFWNIKNNCHNQQGVCKNFVLHRSIGYLIVGVLAHRALFVFYLTCLRLNRALKAPHRGMNRCRVGGQRIPHVPYQSTLVCCLLPVCSIVLMRRLPCPRAKGWETIKKSLFRVLCGKERVHKILIIARVVVMKIHTKTYCIYFGLLNCWQAQNWRWVGITIMWHNDEAERDGDFANSYIMIERQSREGKWWQWPWFSWLANTW